MPRVSFDSRDCGEDVGKQRLGEHPVFKLITYIEKHDYLPSKIKMAHHLLLPTPETQSQLVRGGDDKNA